MAKIFVELCKLYKKEKRGLCDMRGKQEVRGTEPVQVENTPFIKERIRWGELVKVSKKGKK